VGEVRSEGRTRADTDSAYNIFYSYVFVIV